MGWIGILVLVHDLLDEMARRVVYLLRECIAAINEAVPAKSDEG